MKKIFLYSLTLLLISGTAYANPYTVTNIANFFNIGSVDYDAHGWGSVTKLDGIGDWVRWKHQYIFDYAVSSIQSATITLGFKDDEKDYWLNPFSFEVALGWTEGGTWGIGEVDTGNYTFGLGLNELDDGLYYVTLASLWGDFSIVSSELVINYLSEAVDPENTGTVPVPEPAALLLLGTGLFGLAGLSRKKIFGKK